MARYVLEVMYDGNCFHGSQIQGDTPTVQLAINKTLSTLLREDVLSYGASRTDEGVHALSNFYHFDTEAVLQHDFMYKCNAILPQGVAVKTVYAAADDFNVRFAAMSRCYRYRVYAVKNPFLVDKALFFPFPVDFAALQETAALIKGYTDFESFAKRNSQTKTNICTIYESYWEYREEELHYVVVANRFLRGMVRGLVATQLRLARKAGAAENMKKILDAKDCTKAFFNVAGHGLYLESIEYPEGTLEVVQSA